MSERTEGLARHVHREPLVRKLERFVPELEDVAELVDAEAAVGIVGRVALGRVRAEEAPLRELEGAVLGHVLVAFLLGELGHPDLEEVFVALLLPGLVPLHDVVPAVGVHRRVSAAAAARDRVLDLDVLLAFPPVEYQLRSVYAVTILIVLQVLHVVVEQAERVTRVPTVGDDEDGEGLVAEPDEGELVGVGVANTRLEDTLDRELGEGGSALGFVGFPFLLLGHTTENIEDVGVLLVVHLVARRLSVGRQDVVDPFVTLLHAGFARRVEEVDEEVGKVLVRQTLLRRDDIVEGRRPLQLARLSEPPRVP